MSARPAVATKRIADRRARHGLPRLTVNPDGTRKQQSASSRASCLQGELDHMVVERDVAPSITAVRAEDILGHLSD
jgi:hypothetical protein